MSLTVKVKLPCVACDGEGFKEGDEPCQECDEGTAEVELLAKYEVCGTCAGKGSHVNPAIDGNGLSREDFDEDPDFEEAYFAGRYDVPCEECKGLRVTAEVDVERLTDAQKLQHDAAQKREAEIASWDREDAYTRRMEGGGY